MQELYEFGQGGGLRCVVAEVARWLGLGGKIDGPETMVGAVACEDWGSVMRDDDVGSSEGGNASMVAELADRK